MNRKINRSSRQESPTALSPAMGMHPRCLEERGWTTIDRLGNAPWARNLKREDGILLCGVGCESQETTPQVSNAEPLKIWGEEVTSDASAGRNCILPEKCVHEVEQT